MTHVSIGLIAFDSSGQVDFLNMATRRLLGIGPIKSVDDLAKVDKAMAARLFAIRPGKRILTRLERDGEMLKLSLSATEFRLGDRMIKLVSLQDIASELAHQEMQAWQQLVRVLTHEIMNSVTPIASLASTARTMLNRDNASSDSENQLTDSELSDITSAVTTIEKRSDGLIRFVKSYRQLSRIPKPEFQIVNIKELFSRVTQLMVSREEAKEITFQISVDPPTLELTADPDLLEQVLLNLMLNSVQALDGNSSGTVKLSSKLIERGSVIISVSDNGPGLSPEALESVFIPFFTTKPDGTGLGLSLSRQIIRLHGGQISASSAGNETVFTMRF
ncbi:MAG: ATP-binding protein [candidate division Zixibacteria bacterium]